MSSVQGKASAQLRRGPAPSEAARSPHFAISDRRKREALLGLSVVQSQPLEARYRLALQVEALLDASLAPETVAEVAGVKPKGVLLARTALKERDAIGRAKDQARREGVWIVTNVDPGYPQQLLELELPPPCLFCRSRDDPNTQSLLNAPAIGIVGPRNADPYGLEAAQCFASDLAAAGLVITSGFARGVDGTAHRAAALGGHPTVAILGCGVDMKYPRQNQELIGPMLDSGGMIVSEFPLGTPPAAWRFPVRNRLIAAQTIGMIVVQATPRSGSLISARLALDCGRDVFAVPGRIFDVRSKGTNRLLADGAHVALNAASVLETLPLQVQDDLARRTHGDRGAARHRAVLAELQARHSTAEQLSQDLNIDIGTVLQDLTELELGGQIDRSPGGLFTASSPRAD